MSWSKTVTTGKPPSPRAGHTAVAVGNKMVVFGGGDGNRYLNDIIVLDTEKMEWAQLTATGMAPSARSRHTATVIGKKIFVMGGGDESMVYNDLHCLNMDTNTWTRLDASGKEPSARWGHTTTLLSDNSTFVVVGGHDGNSMLNDVYSFDTSSSTWSTLSCKGTPPSARAGHTTDRVGNHLVLFGGGNGVKILNDVHILHLDTLTWQSPSHLDNPPTARCAHTTALADESQHQLIVYGGGDGQRRFRDLYILNVDKLLKHEMHKAQQQQHQRPAQNLKTHNNRPISSPASSTTSAAITTWLESIGIGQYAPHFVREEINMDILPFLTEQHLAEQLGVTTIGARLRIMRAIERLAPSKNGATTPLSRSQEFARASAPLLDSAPRLDLSRSQELSRNHPSPPSSAPDIASLQATIEKLAKTVAYLSSSLQSMGIAVVGPEL
eukprot:Phypoly_transcript_07494.p1 GENE.Phypoly_transcript_07494~~Phypoly_transcript_07494.p1  ORF type:complete len:511 (-),score=89.38 Phypoly_transcript_07494:100-1416(-)